jgi:hypothetical protein
MCDFIAILQHLCAQEMKYNLPILVHVQGIVWKIRSLLGGLSTIVQTKLSSLILLFILLAFYLHQR